MEIKSKETVVSAIEKTKNAYYMIEVKYSGTSSDTITNINVSIYELGTDEIEYGEYIGNIALNDNNMSCSIPDKNQNYISYFSDFQEIVSKIKTKANEA